MHVTDLKVLTYQPPTFAGGRFFDCSRARVEAMPSHPLSAHCACQSCWNALNQDLLKLRDALMQLSLALKDLQFECDVESREVCATQVQHLLANVSRGNSGRSASQPRSNH
jgi:hypothetical protein